MDKEQTDKRKPGASRAFARLLLGAAAAVVAAIVVIAVIAEAWIVPGLVRSKLIQRLSQLNESRVHIGAIRAGYTGPLKIHNLQLYEPNGLKWLDAESISATLANWPGRKPTLTDLEIDRLALQLTPARLNSLARLLHTVGQRAEPDKKKNLDRLTVTDAAVAIVSAEGYSTVYDNLTFIVRRNNDFYSILLNWLGPQTSELLIAKGRVNAETLEADISLSLSHSFRRTETAVLFSTLALPRLSADGRLTADLKIAGSLKEPAELEQTGTVRFEDWTVLAAQSAICNKLNVAARVQSKAFFIEDLSAAVCGGRLAGSFHAELDRLQLKQFAGRIQAENVNMIELSSVLAGPEMKKATRGTMALNYSFTGIGGDLKSIRGEGAALLDDADVSVLPLIPEVFGFLGLKNYEPLKMSDALAEFDTAGPVATIKSARIANRFAALLIEESGTVNLQTGNVDMHVVAAPLKQIDDLFRRLPIINIFVNLKDKLTRLSVKGHWSDPPGKLIKKEPVKDIREGTVGFLKDVAATGGQFGKKVLARFETLFQNKKGSDK